MKFSALILSIAFASIAYAGVLQDRWAALKTHIDKHGGDLRSLTDSEFLKRCELATDLIETPLGRSDQRYENEVYQPWLKTLRAGVVSDRLRQVGAKQADMKPRVDALDARVRRLPDKSPVLVSGGQVVAQPAPPLGVGAGGGAGAHTPAIVTGGSGGSGGSFGGGSGGGSGGGGAAGARGGPGR